MNLSNIFNQLNLIQTYFKQFENMYQIMECFLLLNFSFEEEKNSSVHMGVQAIVVEVLYRRQADSGSNFRLIFATLGLE